MEKIKVNMSPNPLDVQTIHASQNDGEARQWEFELHNNGELIDTSEITEQLFFKAYKGGTEQLLPENGSTPTTSPFIGDIRYPQGLLTDQEFTYRESPTESDGLAKITDIKGNTLVWNQLIQNGNFVNTSGWYSARGTIAVSNNILSYTSSQIGGGSVQNRINRNASFVVGHKYLVLVECKPAHATTLTVQFKQGADITKFTDVSAVWSKNAFIFEPTNAVTEIFIGLAETSSNGYVIGDIDQYRNIQTFDLTQMGLDSITADEFTSLFPLPYYAYNQGTLLSFMGNGIKTVGKNLVNPNDFVQGIINWQTGELNTNVQWITSPFISVFDSTSVTVQGWKDGTEENFMVRFGMYDSSYNVIANSNNINVSSVEHYQRRVVMPSNTKYIRFSCGFNNKTTTPQTFFATNRVMLEFGETASEYEAYTENTTSLPISTYFPTGMKSAGTVYDELTPRKAITRIGAVDLGSLNWTYDSAYTRFYSNGISQYAKKPISDANKANILSAIYDVLSSNTVTYSSGNMVISLSTAGNIVLRNTSYTDVTAFKTAMSGQYLYYELATPTETSFTTASLVTENGEIPLSNDDGTLIGKCTEELSAEPGFHDAKIKLSDVDGECYSNKLQLHVERSPQ